MIGLENLDKLFSNDFEFFGLHLTICKAMVFAADEILEIDRKEKFFSAATAAKISEISNHIREANCFEFDADWCEQSATVFNNFEDIPLVGDDENDLERKIRNLESFHVETVENRWLQARAFLECCFVFLVYGDGIIRFAISAIELFIGYCVDEANGEEADFVRASHLLASGVADCVNGLQQHVKFAGDHLTDLRRQVFAVCQAQSGD